MNIYHCGVDGHPRIILEQPLNWSAPSPCPLCNPPLDLITELARLYAREQNVKIWSDWDAQWNVALGDDLNGYTEEERGLTLEGVAEWLSKRGRE